MVGSFGAGLSLAIASSLILFIVSSVVAFRGWPDDLSGSSSEPTVAQLSESGSGPGTTAPAAKDAAVALPAAPTIQSVTHKQRRAGGSVASGDSSAPSNGRDSSTGSTSNSSTSSGTSGGSGSGSGSPAKTSPGRQVSGAVHQAADTVSSTTKVVGDTVGAVAPDVGRTLETVGASGAAAVDKVGDTAGAAVDSVLP